MKNIQQWITELEQQGVILALVDGQLQIDAPNELMVPELVEQLKARRQELIDSLDDSSANNIPVLSVDVRRGPIPLSFAQERLWFLDEFERGSALYNVPLCVQLTGPLDIQALRHAIEQVVARHEVLRTRVQKSDSDSAYQLITPAVPTLIRKSIQADADSLEALQLAEAAEPFDLSESLKIRFTLADIDAVENQHVLLVTMHHIASDGWSVDVLISELAELYAAFLEKRPAELPVLAVQYADFSAWQRDWLNAGELKTQMDYWRLQLEGAPALIDLPTDRARPATQSFEGSTFEFTVPEVLTQQLQALSITNGATLYMTLLSAFNVLLSRYGAGEDIVVGSPIANRTREETETLIGFFANTLVLRSDLSGEPSFVDLLQRVRNTTLTAFQYQDAPFEKLVEELKPARSTSYSPLFQVMFILQNQSASSLRMPDLAVKPLNVNNSTAKFDLTLGLQEHGKSLNGWMEYSHDLFEKTTIERLSRHFVKLLDEIVKQPDISIFRLPMLGESESHNLIHDLNAAAVAYPRDKTIVDLFMEKARCTPDAIAVIGPNGGSMSYQQLDIESNRLARYLQSLGVASEDRVGIYLERSTEMLTSLIAIMKCGATYIPMDPMFPAERLAFMASDADLNIIVTQHALLDTMPSTQCQSVVIDQQDEDYEKSGSGALQLSVPEAPAYIIYTSGSTGQPKGVQVGHRSLTNFLCSMLDKPGLHESDRLLSVTTLSFDIAALELYAPLLAGATVIIASRDESMDPEKLATRIRDSRANVMQATPATWKMLIEWGWTGSESLRVLCGGEPLSRDLADSLLGKVHELWNLYGPTETTIWSTLAEIVDDNAPVTVGQPIANTYLYLLDDHQQLVPQGVPGELYIGGDGVADGYLNRSALTNERFVTNHFDGQADVRLYRTGDSARWDANGNLELHGRLDDQVKLRGYRIEPGEIRAALVQQALIVDAVVIVREDKPGDHQLVAYLVIDASEQADLDVAYVRDKLGDVMPDYMIPTAWEVLNALPLTPNGKIDRNALPLPVNAVNLSTQEYQAPQGETEQVLAKIWCEVLAVQKVSREDSFFAIGGHSLKAVQVASRIRNELSVEMPLRMLFENPQLKALSAWIESSDPESQHAVTPLTVVSRDGPLALSYAQERLWFLDQLEGASALYNISFSLRLRGELNESALESALQTIVSRHEVLRTRIVSVDGREPEQQVTQTKLVVSRDTVSGSSVDCNARLSTLIKAEAGTAFELSSDLKMRAQLIRVCAGGGEEASDEYHVLLVTMHHIASDGWSLEVCQRELVELYLAGCEDRAAILPNLPVQYVDYAVWQRSWLDDARMRELIDYWRQQLSGAPALLAMPTDHPRPATQGFDGKKQNFSLSSSLTNGLRNLSSTHGTTLYMTLLSAFNVLLSRYSGEDDIVVGSPIANRTREEIEPMIGFFVNTLVLRTDLSGDVSFSGLLDRVRETTLSAYQYQDVPFEKLVGELQPERSLSYSPLFQVMFILQNTVEAELSLGPVAVEIHDADDETAKFDLTLELFEEGEGLSGHFNYNTDLFEPATIARMVGHFEFLLEGIVEQPDVPVAQLPLITAAEQASLLSTSGRSASPYPSNKTVAQLFSEQALRVPTSLAVEGCSGRTLDYAALDRASNRLAHYLLDNGAVVDGKPALIGVYLERDVEMLVALLGVMKAGAAYVPLDPMFPTDRLSLMAEDAQLSVVLTESGLQDSVPGEGVKAIVLDALEDELSQCSEAALDKVSTENTAYVIYTSGSTGRPKGVSVGHQALTNFVCSMQAEPGLLESDCLLAVTTLSFDIAALELYLPLITGAKTVLASREEAMDPEQLSSRLLSSGANVMQATPATWRMLLDGGWSGGEQLKALCGGEALPRELANQLAEQCAELWNMYGPTETTIWSTVSRVESGEGLVSVGHPIANTQVYVLDEGQNLQPAGVSGELYIGGDGVAQGYLDRPELTATQFVADRFSDVPGARLYRTGDRARMRADGTLEVLGRLDEQVKLRGYRIEPGEIRARLIEDEQINDAVVVVREDVAGDAQLVAYLVLDGESEIDYGGLRKMLQGTLPDYMIPTAWMEMDEFPLTPNGKVNRKVLPVPESVALSTVEYEAPQTQTEKTLAGIWSELLGVEQVGLGDNFFALGGHSLKAVQVASRVRDELGRELPLKSVFESPTLKEISRVVDSLPHHTLTVPTGDLGDGEVEFTF